MDGKINVYHPLNVLLPTRLAGFWIVHDEIESLHKQAIVNAAKFLLHDGEIDVIGIVSTKTAEAVAAIVLYLGISSIIDILTGGGGGTPPAPIDVSAINNAIINNEINLNSLSTASTLSINNLNNT